MKIGIVLALAGFLASVAYVLWHLWRITPGGWPWKSLVTGVYVLWMLLLFWNIGFSEKLPIAVDRVCQAVGNPWLMAHFYLTLILIVADLATLFRFHPAGCLHDSLGGLCSIAGIVGLILLSGHLRYEHKYREELTIHTGKPLEKPLKIVLASDLHVGYTVSRKELAGWIDLFNAEHADLILFGGDIVDLQIRPVRVGGFAEEFHRLNAPAYTVLGNHEYYGDLPGAQQFFSDAGIGLLRDSVVHFKGIDIVGRDDRSNPLRKTVGELTDSLSGFTLLLDHQPFHLEDAEAAGIGFQFSGHTHRGQVWPLSWVTEALFEKAWGPYQRGNTRYYISSGMGIWGPKIRVGTRSEYVVLYLD